MKFVFKRKYTGIFFVTLLLIGLTAAFYVHGPDFIKEETLFFIQASVLALIDVFVILMFIFGLYKVNYYLYHDRIEIHRSCRKKLIIPYNNIKQVTEIPNDTIILIFGRRPSFKIKYTRGRRTKKHYIRVANHELLKLVLTNEKQIHVTLNK